jgi:hypothetical protein
MSYFGAPLEIPRGIGVFASPSIVEAKKYF